LLRSVFYRHQNIVNLAITDTDVRLAYACPLASAIPVATAIRRTISLGTCPHKGLGGPQHLRRLCTHHHFLEHLAVLLRALLGKRSLEVRHTAWQWLHWLSTHGQCEIEAQSYRYRPASATICHKPREQLSIAREIEAESARLLCGPWPIG
jgi:hypothetical protein